MDQSNESSSSYDDPNQKKRRLLEKDREHNQDLVKVTLSSSASEITSGNGVKTTSDVQNGISTTASSVLTVGIPTLQRDIKTGMISSQKFFDAFERYHAVYIPRKINSSTTPTTSPVESSSNNVDGDTPDKSNCSKDMQEEHAAKKKILSSNDIYDLFMSLTDKNDRDSWCIENRGSINANTKTDVEGSGRISNYDFLRVQDDEVSKTSQTGYCSFIIQNDKNVLETTLKRLPAKDLPISSALCDNKSSKSEASNREDAGYSYKANKNGTLDCESPGVSDKNENNGSTYNSSNNNSVDMTYGPCLWFFFGRNNDRNESLLQGRPEHTDSITHDATWHYQLSGTKQWVIRPTLELLKNHINKDAASRSGGSKKEWPLQLVENNEKKSKDSSSSNSTEMYDDSNGGIPVTVECQKGDILVINTRLWWHQTFIPNNFTEKSIDIPSVSYARDVYFNEYVATSESVFSSSPTSEAKEKPKTKATSSSGDTATTMTNVDGLYAANDIDTDTIIFKEDDMPDCELHRSSNPNCKIVELEDSGMGAVVSIRPILAGEFFTVAESDDESDDGDYEEEEEEEDEEEKYQCIVCPN